MNVGTFEAQVSLAWKILGEAELEEEKNYAPQYPAGIAAMCRGLSYVDEWKLLVKGGMYHFQLRDYSLIQLRYESEAPLCVSYAYYECPWECEGFSSYLESHKFAPDDRYDPDARELYEQYVAECPLKQHVTPVRYDHDPEIFTKHVHPASHFHFGRGSEVRIATERVLRPTSFVLFIIRQFYPAAWLTLMSHGDIELWCKDIRENCDLVAPGIGSDKAEREMLLR